MRIADTTTRSTFQSIVPRANVKPTTREILWLKHIERHGPQSSQYLFELTRNTHRCKDTALRQLQKLRSGGLLRLPPQQRETEHADFNPYVYDITKAAKKYLYELATDEPTIRPTGHWWHGYITSCVTSSIDIAAENRGVGYIPAHAILVKTGALFEITQSVRKIIPDQLFALDYGGAYRGFILEVDRGTEPIQSAAARKSLARSVRQYAELIESDHHKRHYGLKMNMLILWIFTSRSRQAQFLELLKDCSDRVRQSVATKAVNQSELARRPEEELFEGKWERQSHPGFRLCE